MSTTVTDIHALAKHDGRRVTARDRLLEAAGSLFYRHGIRAVGVDEVAKTAGVAKASLYRSFPSKDDLIVAYLEQRDDAFWRAWDIEIACSSKPGVQLHAVVAYLRRTFEDGTYRGCPFANFASEFPDRDHAGRKIVERSKGELRHRLSDLCIRANLPEAAQRADALTLAIEGAISLSQTAEKGGQLAASSLAWTAEALLAPRAL